MAVGPSTHQDSPKVPERRACGCVASCDDHPRCQPAAEAWPSLAVYKRKGPTGKPTTDLAPLTLRADYVTETYIPVSALLSDEVVERLAKTLCFYQKGIYWVDAEAVDKGIYTLVARCELLAVIERVGGGQG